MKTRRVVGTLCCGTLAAVLVLNCTQRETPSGPAIPPPDPGPAPQVLLQRVLRSGEAPCVGTAPCTLGVGSTFEFEVSGDSPDHTAIAGFQWQAAWPGDSLADAPMEPDCRSGGFLPAGDGAWRLDGFPADSLQYCIGAHATECTAGAPRPDTLFAIRSGVLRVRYGPRATQFSGAAAGRFVFRARVRDAAGRTSPFDTILVALNRPPATAIERIAACDCPQPPPQCGAADSVRAGWITGTDFQPEWPPERWIRFCDGDTLPVNVRVRFFVRGHDDPRDHNCESQPDAALSYSYRFEWSRGTAETRFMPYSRPVLSGLLAVPDGTWAGGSVSWFGTLPVDYVFYAATVDPLGKFDATPDSIRFHGDFPPAIDSLSLATVVVLIPQCPSGACDFGSPVFGPDTVAVYGHHLPDNSFPEATPLRLGYNEFVLPVQASGADHPADRSLPRTPDNGGRIFAWWYELQPTAGDPPLPALGMGFWIDDRAGANETGDRQHFDPELVPLVVALDTLYARPSGTRARLSPVAHRPVQVRIRARDTCARQATGSDVLSLDPGITPVDRQIIDLGRVSPFVARTFVFRELLDVRPVTAPGAAWTRRR
jgi:hypothetical protein